MQDVENHEITEDYEEWKQDALIGRIETFFTGHDGSTTPWEGVVVGAKSSMLQVRPLSEIFTVRLVGLDTHALMQDDDGRDIIDMCNNKEDCQDWEQDTPIGKIAAFMDYGATTPWAAVIIDARRHLLRVRPLNEIFTVLVVDTQNTPVVGFL